MRSIGSLLWTSVGRKFFVAVSGLCLIGFLCTHLLGNLTLFLGPSEFNAYAHKLLSLGPLLYVAELGLLALFLLHVFVAIIITRENRSARGKGYAVTKDAGGKSKKTFASRTMIYSGLVVFAFVVWHVKMFKYGAYYEVNSHGLLIRDLYKLIAECFSNGLVVALYSLCMIILGFHLRHAIWSVFQTLGFSHPRYSPILQTFGIIMAFSVSIGFLILPIFIYFKHTGGF